VLEAENQKLGVTNDELGMKGGGEIVYNRVVQVKGQPLAYPQAAADMMSGRASGYVQEETLLTIEFEAG
jgi:hypothetical protein